MHNKNKNNNKNKNKKQEQEKSSVAAAVGISEQSLMQVLRQRQPKILYFEKAEKECLPWFNLL